MFAWYLNYQEQEYLDETIIFHTISNKMKVAVDTQDYAQL